MTNYSGNRSTIRGFQSAIECRVVEPGAVPPKGIRNVDDQERKVNWGPGLNEVV